ncbi:hypothetical protein SBA4_830009 [Candidatus Sulfopaludibacter sp. SbA4]|nr:hypothetical protein SBA4_830009 [Candidatus Sulfopaludibacter sp. SbA4]
MSIQRLFAEHPYFVDERVPATDRVNKLTRDNRRLVIHDEPYDLDMEVRFLRRHDPILSTVVAKRRYR